MRHVDHGERHVGRGRHNAGRRRAEAGVQDAVWAAAGAREAGGRLARETGAFRREGREAAELWEVMRDIGNVSLGRKYVCMQRSR